MTQPLAAVIAWRYLRKEKTRGAVGTISTVSVCAMAIATAAIICVLSVFNGFRDIIGNRLDALTPDVKVTPAAGKVFANADSLAKTISGFPGVAIATPTLSDNALVITNGHEMPVTLKGVYPEGYAAVTSVRRLIPADYGRYFAGEDKKRAVASVGVASRMRVAEDTPLLIFAPRREGRVNMANPAASFISDSLFVSGIYRSDQQEYDEDGLLVPIETARELLQYDTQASAIEIKARESADVTRLADDLQDALGPDFRTQDRFEQQQLNFRMVKIEKWVSFMLLGFILLIASFNCISSLSMLVIEKEGALSTFAALGMSRRRIGTIFAWESMFVTLAGGLAGVALGVGLTLLQQYFGLIKIGGDPGAAVISVYPVRLIWTDVAITLVPILAIGALTAVITGRFARSRIRV